MMLLKVGAQFARPRNFKPAEYGRPGWWLLSLSQPGATAQGLEIIEIIEVVQTETIGALAIFHHQVIDPDGRIHEDCFAPDARKTNFRNEKILCQNLKRMGLQPVHLSS
jgi:hypothetical protein